MLISFEYYKRLINVWSKQKAKINSEDKDSSNNNNNNNSNKFLEETERTILAVQDQAISTNSF
jgi:hypothetical protein